jgi:hypothetical protein
VGASTARNAEAIAPDSTLKARTAAALDSTRARAADSLSLYATAPTGKSSTVGRTSSQAYPTHAWTPNGYIAVNLGAQANALTGGTRAVAPTLSTGMEIQLGPLRSGLSFALSPQNLLAVASSDHVATDTEAKRALLGASAMDLSVGLGFMGGRHIPHISGTFRFGSQQLDGPSAAFGPTLGYTFGIAGVGLDGRLGVYKQLGQSGDALYETSLQLNLVIFYSQLGHYRLLKSHTTKPKG